MVSYFRKPLISLLSKFSKQNDQCLSKSLGRLISALGFNLKPDATATQTDLIHTIFDKLIDDVRLKAFSKTCSREFVLFKLIFKGIFLEAQFILFTYAYQGYESTVSAVSATGTKTNWSDLPQDLISTIFEKLIDDVEDIIACSRVCVSWQQSFKHFFPAPFILFTRQGYETAMGYCYLYRRYVYDTDDVPFYNKFYRLFNSRTGKRDYLIWLPELQGKYFCSASHGWLLTANAGCDFLQEMTLLNPLTQAEIKLPCPWRETSRLQRHFRVITSLPPSNPNSIVSGLYKGDNHVGFCRQGDQTWNKFAFSHDNALVDDALFLKGEFYFVGYINARSLLYQAPYHHYVYRIRFDETVPDLNPLMERLLLLPKVDDDDNSLNRINYLVELIDELLLVSIYYRGSYYATYELTGMSVHKLEFDGAECRWVRLTSLGDYAIYVGFCQSVSVFVGEGNRKDCRRNCVYFIANMSVTCEGAFDFWPSFSKIAPNTSVVKVFDLENEGFEDLYIKLLPVQDTLLSWFRF